MQAKNLFKKAMITMCSAVMLMGIGAVGVNAEQGTVGDFTVDRNYKTGYVVRIISYNGNGKVDIIDITEAQRYYQATSLDANWEEKAKVMDVNGDNKVDIQDYIDIFNNLSDF